MKSVFSLIIIVQLLGLSTAKADMRLIELFRKEALKKTNADIMFAEDTNTMMGRLDKPAVQSLTFNQKLDQDNSNDTRTFAQRYFIISDYASQPASQAPVLFFICGEAACDPNEAISDLGNHAKKLGAHIIAVEHRYYGKSLPFTQLSTENLKYLSTDYALKDLAAIQKYLMANGFGGKWISVGGSYSGSLSAFYREKYPDLVVGALASSAPVQARANFENYDFYVSKVAGQECDDKMRDVTKQIESVLGQPDQLAVIKKKFAADMLTDNTDFLYVVADVGAFAIQYGMKDQFCGMIVKGTNDLDMYAQFANYVYMAGGFTPLSDSVQGAMNETVDPNAVIGQRQWFYQSCTEYGYWQVAYHDPAISVRSSRINLAYHQQACKRLFNLDIAGNEQAMNAKFYEPLLNPQVTNILFTNGSQDPWSELSISAANGNNTNKNLTLFTIDGAAHCGDLANQGTNTEALVQSQTLFETLATSWLN